MNRVIMLFFIMVIVISFMVLGSNYKIQQSRMYELEMRVFYLEDVLAKHYYGNDISEQYQFDMTDK